MDRLLRPKSVVIVGASPTPGSLGASVLANLEAARYGGDLYLVNPRRTEIGGRPCVPSIADLPAGVDCAVLAIPHEGVLDAVRLCGKRGVGGVIVFSAGFAETGMAGAAQQRELKELAQASGLLLQGPNCLGIVNYIDGIPLTFVSTEMAPPAAEGSAVAVVSQSGAMAAVLGTSLRSHGLEISFSISTGNEAASGAEDFLEYVLEDVHTRVVAMIVEQFRQPKRFLQLVAKAESAGKKIVLLHPGRSSAARSSAATHTGALAGDYQLMRVKSEHAGVVMVDSIEELVDATQILIRCPSLPAGGAAVFTESGAFKALTLDMCEKLNLKLPFLSERTAENLRKVLPSFIPPSNPLDITAQGLTDPDLYRRTLPPILADDGLGSVVLAIILTDERTAALKFPPILAALREIHPAKPIVFAAMDEGAVFDGRYVTELRALGVPFFPSPDRAFRALAKVTASATRRLQDQRRPTKSMHLPGMKEGTLTEYVCKELFRGLGIPVPPGKLATRAQDAVAIAAELGYPVALKAQASSLTHKSDVGGVALNLKTEVELRAAWDKMYSDVLTAMPELELDGLLVEKMGERGVELIVGARQHPEWGPSVLVGFGGVLAELIGDVVLLPTGLSREAIAEAIFGLKSANLLRGFRGSKAVDVSALADFVSTIGDFMESNPSVMEMDINPLMVRASGVEALDAVMVVRPG